MRSTRLSFVKVVVVGCRHVVTATSGRNLQFRSNSALTDDDGATTTVPQLRPVGITIRDSALNDDGRATGAAEYGYGPANRQFGHS